jgi:hypothetical protein
LVHVLNGFKAHFTLVVKVKVEFKSNIPIGAITTFSPKGFTLKSRSKNKIIFFNLPLYGLDLTLRSKKDTYQLGRPICNPWSQWGCNKILLFWWNPHYRIKINPKSNLIFSTSLFFHFFSFFFLVKILCLFVNNERSFYFFFLGYGREKHKKYKNLVSMLIHGGLTLKV